MNAVGSENVAGYKVRQYRAHHDRDPPGKERRGIPVVAAKASTYLHIPGLVQSTLPNPSGPDRMFVGVLLQLGRVRIGI